MMNEIPSFLVSKLQNQYGVHSEEILQGYSCRRCSSFRINRLKADHATVFSVLKKNAIDILPVSWYEDAFWCKNEEALRETSCYKNGEIYLQSLSSMLPPLVVAPKSGENVLDMTAAPGGKTTQLAALSHGKALITACERDKIRFERLKYNVDKQGATRVTVLQKDAMKLDEFFRFDKILLDAPCSGSGTIDLRSPIKISEKLISSCMKMQTALLQKAFALLKTGGELVYSTCSVLRCENEDIIQNLLRTHRAKLVPITLDKDIPRLPSMEGTLCVCPTEFFEGFFIAKLQKI